MFKFEKFSTQKDLNSLFINPNALIILENLLYFILVLNFIAILFLGLCRLIILKSGRKVIKRKKLMSFPMVSIHLAICNEPVDVVLKTVRSVLNIDYPNFELIIISNNTKDESLWKPIEAFCYNKKNIKFWNYNNVSGYKAGALNIALQYTDRKASYIFVLDADYVLKPNALKTAVWKINEDNVDLVQFPQSYWNTSNQTIGLVANYNHYFDCYMTRNSFKETCLPTGTLSIIKRSVFTKGNIWPTDSITEDANLGVEMLSRNLKISFCNLIIGQGVMPTSIPDYFKQYQRWLFGNFQTLFKLVKIKGINFKEKLKLATLLTAWLNLLSATIVISIAVLPLIAILNFNIEKAVLLCALNITTHIIIQYSILFKLLKNNSIKAFNSLLIHLSTIDIGSFYWLGYFINSKKPFIRTNKFLDQTLDLPKYYFATPYLFLVAATTFMGLNFAISALLFLALAILFYISKKLLIKEINAAKYNCETIIKL